MIRDQGKELAEKYRKWEEQHGQNPEIPDAFDIYETEILNSSEFPNILNKSIYLTIYSMFENEFYKLCEGCQYTKKLNLGPKDLKESNNIGQCRKYLIKVLNVNLDSLNKQWSEIGNYQQIRNSIAHNNGVLKNTKQGILDFIISTEGISIDNKTSEIEINSVEFLKTLIDRLVNYLTDTIEEIVNQKESQENN